MLLKLLIRNTFRNRLRVLLTVCGICVAVLAFGMLRTVVSAWYAGVSASSATRLVTRNAISLIFPLPLSYEEKIRAVDGVTIVAAGNWFGAYYVDRKNFFANFAVEADSYLRLYPEYVLPPDQKIGFMRDRKGCVVGAKLARKYGWKVGDNIVLTGTIYPGQWPFVLRAVYTGRDETVDETQFFFHWEYLNESMKKSFPRRADQVGFYMVGIADPDRAAQVAEAIDATFKNSYAETLTETEKAFALGFISMSETILNAIQLVSAVIIVIIMAVMANTMAMSVRERLGEYAVFKTLGFSSLWIGALIFGESLIIAVLGGLLGVALTYPAATAFRKAVGTIFPIFNVETRTIFLDMGAALLVGIVASIVPVWRAVSVRVAEGLRRLG